MRLAIALLTIASLGAFAAPAPKPQADTNTPTTKTTKKVKKQKPAKVAKAKKAKKNTETTPSK